jgi:hypothetical protein
MNEAGLWKPALIAGVVMGILSSLPLAGCLCCVWTIAGGVLASYLYVKDSPVQVKLGRGVQLGLLTGFVGAIIIGLFSIPMQLLLGHGSFVEQVRQSMEQMPNVPPETKRMAEAFVANKGIIYAFSAIFMLGYCGLLSMTGGAIGVALFEKRKPGDGEIPPVYQPPSPPTPPAEGSETSDH